MKKNTLSVPIKIVGYEENANLREVNWNQRFLEKVKDEYNLQHKQAVLYINTTKDRFRLVANFFDLAVLILPPIDPADQISLYLKISEFLKKFSVGFGDAIEFLDHEIDNSQKRINRRKKLAEKALNNRNKE